MEKYLKFSIRDLILLAVCSVESKKEDCTFDRLVYECFTLFPKKFAFSRYPQWPDSHKLDRHLRKLQEHSLLIGTRVGSFKLSLFGKKLCDKLNKKELGINLKIQRVNPTEGRKEKILINRIKNSKQYQQFLNDEGSFSISKSDIRFLFLCTEETLVKVVLQNINYLKELSQDIRDSKLYQFLDYCSNTIKTS